MPHGAYFLQPSARLSYCWQASRLANFGKSPKTGRRVLHLDRTSTAMRNETILPATIVSTSQLSPTVMGFTLKVARNEGISFKAGQWIDLFIPKLKTVGGFSICSPPAIFEQQGLLELAVKYADHPPAKWLHLECTPQSSVQLRFGGDFLFDPSTDRSNLLLIAGGVGINPLKSIAEETLQIVDHVESNVKSDGRLIRLLYSARSSEELLFKDSFEKLSAQCPGFTCQFFDSSHGDRITNKSISEAIASFGNSKNFVKAFICGPPNMIDFISKVLIDHCGLSKENVKFEKWW